MAFKIRTKLLSCPNPAVGYTIVLADLSDVACAPERIASVTGRRSRSRGMSCGKV
jgi:hypothetical protein